MPKTDPAVAVLANNLSTIMCPTDDGLGERRISLPLFKGGTENRVAMQVAAGIVHLMRENGLMPKLPPKRRDKPKKANP
ncbi:hypothetical protein G4X40_19830 [Rhodococcus sp. D2-41]|uniref:hypothetical protein n=1 Tax=Speluncibacter jeojiensis TaxID=2710754 RepID=UPI00240FBEFE|nr:hypothetical protein [Rhodococcus sp. D2-41]MDG3012394.1 hypothetical protein [Rhodococcus sp. D2-41]